jgi:choline dehydrogenase-like flavoprotein
VTGVEDGTTFDFVVVGGGSAGAVLARRLAEQTQDSVALIEAGPSDSGRDEILTLQRWPELIGSAYDYHYRIERQEGINPRLIQNRARVLGGCSSHNLCEAWRLPDADLRDWEAAGATGWGPDDVRGCFDRVLARTGIGRAAATNDAAAAFIDAGVQAGYPLREWAAEGGREGVGWVPLNAIDGRRRSSSVAYLHPLSEAPAHLAVLTDTPVSRIRFDGRRATGVDTTRGFIGARREVLLCAGAFDSPKLLMLSGVGPAAHLQSLGIDLIADVPAGEHLLDHPEGFVTYETTRAIVQPDTTWVDAVVLARTPWGGEGLPEIALWFFSGHFGAHETKFGAAAGVRTFALAFDVLSARSEGRVSLRSTSAADAPRIEMNYFTDPDGHDERVLLAGLKLARRVASQPALQPWIRRETAPGPQVVEDGELVAYAKSALYTAYHPCGTCRMGAADDPRAVVDPTLRVRGVEGLRVADASIFPRLPRVNPNIACMMIGERAAELVIEP